MLHLIDGENYHDDGQIKDEVFEHGSFLQSKMFRKNIKCSDCHDPHTSKPKHLGNALCTSCHQHPTGKYDTPAHTHHAPNTSGSSCVECHMPQTTYMVVHRRRDHSIRIPRPDLSVKLGVPNACNQCHDGLKTPEQQDRSPRERARMGGREGRRMVRPQDSANSPLRRDFGRGAKRIAPCYPN
ncbi:MAG: cytochrome c3 family protein [Pirellulales bacterium]